MRRSVLRLCLLVQLAAVGCGGDAEDARDTPGGGTTSGGRGRDAGGPTATADGGGSPGAGTPGDRATAEGPIETVVIDSVDVKRAGITTSTRVPVALFRDGWACTKMSLVASGEDPKAQRAKAPQAWLEWKRKDGKVLLLRDGSWQPVRYEGEYPPLPRGATVDGTWVHAAASGSGQSKATLQLTSDHRFSEKLEEVATGSVIASTPRVNEQGTYEILGGYRAALRYGTGVVVETTFVHGPTDPRTIYVGGVWYELAP